MFDLFGALMKFGDDALKLFNVLNTTINTATQMAKAQGYSVKPNIVLLKGFGGNDDKRIAIVFDGLPDIADDALRNIIQLMGVENVEIISVCQ